MNADEKLMEILKDENKREKYFKKQKIAIGAILLGQVILVLLLAFPDLRPASGQFMIYIFLFFVFAAIVQLRITIARMYVDLNNK